MFNFNKKGSLNLSVQAIVIVVLAMTILGLGLTFVRGQFETIGSTGEQVQQQIRQQILSDLRRGDKKLSFPTNRIEGGTDTETVQAIGVKNTGDDRLNLRLKFKIQAAEQENGDIGFVSVTSGSPRTLYSKDDQGDVTESFSTRVDWDSSTQRLAPGDSRVLPATIQLPNTQGNYLYKVIVNNTDSGNVYASKSFFINAQ